MFNARTIFKVFGTFLILSFSGASASACLWITGTTYEGQPKRASGIGSATYLRSFLSMDHYDAGIKMQSTLANSTNFNDRGDYAVSLVYVGKTREAVELLEGLESEQPGTYIVAANLGTALELLGRNDEALYWIREGIRRMKEQNGFMRKFSKRRSPGKRTLIISKSTRFWNWIPLTRQRRWLSMAGRFHPSKWERPFNIN